jgi:Glycosyltransferase WbsX/IPT/TIG domain
MLRRVHSSKGLAPLGTPISASRLFVRITLFLAPALAGCGGASVPPSENPIPTVSAISPNSSTLAGPAFTLSVVGDNFINGSTLQWNGSALTTTVVSSQLITAQIPASNITAPGPYAISVSNPAPGGGTSNSVSLAVPCVIPALAPAAAQTQARLGAYFFDGWSGPLTNFHFMGLPLGPYQDRQPVTGWQDNSACAIEQELAVAHNFGVDFFVFDWYFNAAANDPGENLNSAIEIMHGLADRHGMQYAILYVDGSPFVAGPADWAATIDGWLSYMTDPAYLQINGKPVLFIIDVGQMYQTFGSDAGVQTALQQLRTAAQGQGLPGVYVIGGFGIPDGTLGQYSMASGFSLSQADGYDAICYYNYPYAPPAVNGAVPFSTLSEAGHWTWDEAAQNSPLPFIPVAMAGWDPRPWGETEPITNDLMWYTRSPQDFATFVSDAIGWTNANPTLRPEPAPTPPLVMIEAWNEFGEGSHFIPTVGDGTSYGDALAAMLLAPPAAAADAPVKSEPSRKP